MFIIEPNSLDAEDHRRALALLSEPLLVPPLIVLTSREDAPQPEPGLEPVLADEMLLRAFPEPPLPVTITYAHVSFRYGRAS
jgi:hypothetical protein